VANPTSIFSGGVASRWGGTLPARLLPSRCIAPFLSVRAGD